MIRKPEAVKEKVERFDYINVTILFGKVTTHQVKMNNISNLYSRGVIFIKSLKSTRI